MEPSQDTPSSTREPQELLPEIQSNPLDSLFPKLESVLETMKSKFDTQNSLLFLKPTSFHLTLKTLKNFTFTSQNPSTEKYQSIVDCLNFITARTIDSKTLSTLITSLQPKGTLLLLLNVECLKQITSAMKALFPKEYNISLFIKLYIIDKVPFYGLLSISTMGEAKSAIDIDAIKLLSYELYEDNTLTKPITYTMNNLEKSITTMNQIYARAKAMATIVPGRIHQLVINENFYSDKVDYHLTIVDLDNSAPLHKRNVCSVIISKAYTEDFIYLSHNGIISMCQQTLASRVILIRSSPLNYDSTYTIKAKLNPYIILFTFEGCPKDNITIRLMSDEKNEQYKLYDSKTYFIRDIVANEKKETYRQLFTYSNPGEVIYQQRLLLTSKAKANKEKGIYFQLPTIDKFQQKNLVTCRDDKIISNFYMKAALSSILFINLDDFPMQSLKILILGGGIGLLSYYYEKICKGNVVITIIEPDKEIAKIGKEYFGVNDDSFKNLTIEWKHEPLSDYVKTIKEKEYYDMIIVDNWRGKESEMQGTVPPRELFEHENLDIIVHSMKSKGIFVMHLLGRSYINLLNTYESMEKVFSSMFSVANNEDLDKIFFCFKTKKDQQEYQDMYTINIEKLSKKENADISWIVEEHKRILQRVEDLDKFKFVLNSHIY